MPLPFGARQHDPPLAFQQSRRHARPAIPLSGGARRGTRDFDEAAIGGAGGIPQPLGMPRRPQKAPAEEQPRRVGIERRADSRYGRVRRNPLIADHPPALIPSHQRPQAQSPPPPLGDRAVIINRSGARQAIAARLTAARLDDHSTGARNSASIG